MRRTELNFELSNRPLYRLCLVLKQALPGTGVALLLALEAVTKASSLYTLPLIPGKKRMAVLVLSGPNEQAELKGARARGYVAELDTPENNARWLG